MAATPKKKSTRSRAGKRRAKNHLRAPNFYPCPSCGKLKSPHIVCPHCGAYGRLTFGSETAQARREQSRKATKPEL